MSLAYFTTVAFLIANLMGAAWAAPTTPTSANQTEVESDSQPKIKATVGNNRTESAAPPTPGVGLTSEFQEEAECQTAWQNFIVDFSVQYASDEEAQKRRNIFCANWQRIQEHNVQYQAGKVSFKKKINQWSDWTIDEWKDKQRPLLPPEFDKAKPTTETSEKDQTRIKCQTAWEKFLTDFSRKYENDEETEKRRCIFCNNWQRIQEHNVLYEAGKVSHKKSINQWSDLTFEEWKQMQEPSFPPNMDTPGNKTEPTEEQGYLKISQYTFPVNVEEPGTFVAETILKPKLVNEEQPVEVPSQIKELQQPFNKELPGQKTEENVVESLSQHIWFPPNTEEPGIYLVRTEASEVGQKGIKCQAPWEKFLTDYAPKYENDVETEKRRSIFCDNWQRIQEHNAQFELGKVSYKESTNGWSDLTSEELKSQNPDILPPSLKPSENKTEETIVEVGSQQVWFPPNTEEPGTYVVKTDTSEDEKKGIKCQAAWEKFLIDYAPKYENDVETEKRRSIFCDNWQRIQEHNAQFELGKVSYKESTNGWSDLTSEELKSQNPDILPPSLKPSENKTEETIVEVGSQQVWFPPNTEEPGTYVVKTDTSEDEKKGIKCQAAWEKFLTDFSRKYENDEETEKRRSIFCDNWQRIQEHNVLYEAGKVSYKKSINQWSDLRFEEWKQMQEPLYPPNMETPGNKTEQTVTQFSEESQNTFPANMEEHGTYVASLKPKLLNEEQLVEEGSLIEKPANRELTGNQTEEAIVEIGSQEDWFPANNESPGTYIVKTDASENDKKEVKCKAAWEKFLIDYTPKYENDVETEKRRSIFCDNWQRIQEHNAQFELGKVSYKESTNGWSDLTSEELKSQNPDILPPSLKPSENKTEETLVEVGSQQVWFPPNMEEPGLYIAETTLEPKALDIEFSDEVRQIEDLEEPVNTKLPGTFPAKPPKKSNSSNEDVLIE